MSSIIVVRRGPKVDVARIRRHRVRTMARPAPYYVASAEEMEATREYATHHWHKDNHADYETGLTQWRREVKRYCRAQGLRPIFKVTPHGPGVEIVEWLA